MCVQEPFVKSSEKDYKDLPKTPLKDSNDILSGLMLLKM
jgi:hypothetical protein